MDKDIGGYSIFIKMVESANSPEEERRVIFSLFEEAKKNFDTSKIWKKALYDLIARCRYLSPQAKVCSERLTKMPKPSFLSLKQRAHIEEMIDTARNWSLSISEDGMIFNLMFSKTEELMSRAIGQRQIINLLELAWDVGCVPTIFGKAIKKAVPGKSRKNVAEFAIKCGFPQKAEATLKSISA